MKLINNSLTRKLLVLLLCVYFILGAAALALRYWVPLKINDWRPQIEARLGESLGLDVSLDTIKLRWYGWQPSILIENAELKDQQTKTLLQIPSINLDLDWTALFNRYSGLIKLRVNGMDLAITRVDRTNLQILDQKIDLLGDNFNIVWLTTLLDQPYISFSNTTIRWLDLYRSAPELRLTDIHAVLAHDRQGNPGLSMDAYVPQASLANIQMKAHLDKKDLVRSLENLTDFEAWIGVSNFKFDDWLDWMDIPAGLTNNNASLQIWLDTKSANRKLTVLAKADEPLFVPDEKLVVRADRIVVLLEDGLGDITARDLLDTDSSLSLADDIKFDVQVNRLFLDDKNIFLYPLEAKQIRSNGGVDYAESLKVNVSNLFFENEDIKFDSFGSWQSGPGAGETDFIGQIEYANLAAIYKYLPNDVDPDAHDWLKDGLLAGNLADGDFYLRGDLNDFPFGLKSEAGDFLVAGDFTDARIELVPDADLNDRWPQLYVVDGFASLQRASLYLKSDHAFMSPVDGHKIELSKLLAVIPDIEYDSVLSVKGTSQASGGTYLELIKNTPLSGMIGDIFDEASASGQWQVPLSLVVPLSNSIDTRVNGSVDFDNAELQFFPAAPRFTDISGSVDFTEEGIRMAQPLKASLLGGAVKLTGGIGGAQADGLYADGTLTAKALAGYAGTYGMRRVQGALNYSAHLEQKGDIYTLSMNSDTAGLALDLPAPLSKPADEKMSLNIVWSDTGKTDESLKVSLGDVLRLDSLHTKGATKGPYFHSAAIGIQRAAKIEGPSGLTVDVDYPLINLDEWDDIIREFEKPAGKTKQQANNRVIWPALRLFSLQADQLQVLGTRMDRSVVRVQKKEAGDWSLTINSDQTSGNIKWQEQNGKLLGTVRASFDQLSVGNDPEDTSSLLPESDGPDRIVKEDIDIPAMVIEANNLKVFGRSFGHLNLEGTLDAKNEIWTLDRLRLGNDESAMLKGTGTWHLSGPDRGLKLNADVDMQNLGLWMNIAGWKDILAGGSGNLKGKFDWKNLPWDTNVADLHGELKADLVNGRFIKVNSSSAKLLEFLSLQSITRLNKIEKGVLDLTEEGFPFDQLHGNMQLQDGGVDIIDYKITGPVATILIEGKANIVRRDMDLDAVVVPNIDVSGAAVAAGIAINPIVGLGAFLTQWLLKEPLANSMTVRYKVSGSWDDPKATEVPVSKK